MLLRLCYCSFMSRSQAVPYTPHQKFIADLSIMLQKRSEMTYVLADPHQFAFLAVSALKHSREVNGTVQKWVAKKEKELQIPVDGLYVSRVVPRKREDWILLYIDRVAFEKSSIQCGCGENASIIEVDSRVAVCARHANPTQNHFGLGVMQLQYTEAFKKECTRVLHGSVESLVPASTTSSPQKEQQSAWAWGWIDLDAAEPSQEDPFVLYVTWTRPSIVHHLGVIDKEEKTYALAIPSRFVENDRMKVRVLPMENEWACIYFYQKDLWNMEFLPAALVHEFPFDPDAFTSEEEVSS